MCENYLQNRVSKGKLVLLVRVFCLIFVQQISPSLKYFEEIPSQYTNSCWTKYCKRLVDGRFRPHVVSKSRYNNFWGLYTVF